MNAERLADSTATVLRVRRTRTAATGRGSALVFRQATADDAAVLQALIERHRDEGHLLKRTLDELAEHAARFVIAVGRRHIIGCAELAPLSASVAEVRSLVVDRDARGLGAGRALVAALQQRGRCEGFETLCAFTHDAGYFEHLGFTEVPHAAVPEKIAMDCRTCPLLGRCGQHAVVLPLSRGGRRRSGGRVEPVAVEGS